MSSSVRAFLRLVAVEHGVAHVLEVEGDAVGHGEQQDQRPDEREGDADRIAHELDGLAPRKRPDAAEIECPAGVRAGAHPAPSRRVAGIRSRCRLVVGILEVADEGFRQRSPRGVLRVSSAGVPTARMRPACMSETRSQRSASFTKWVEMKIVTPSSRDSSISSSQKPSRAIGSTPEVGSSRISISGL